MQEAEFRRRLAGKLTPESIQSYVSYASRVEDVLYLDLDLFTLDENGIADVGQRLRQSGINQKSVSNCMSAIRAYAKAFGKL